VAEPLPEPAHDRGLLLDRTGPERRADDRETPGEQQRQVDLALRPAHEPDLDEPAADGERRQVLREVLGPDVVEDAADAVAIRQRLYALGEVLRLVVDGGRRAERFTAPCLV